MKNGKGYRLRDLSNVTLEPISYYMKPFNDQNYPGMGMHTHPYFEIMYSNSGHFILEIFDEKKQPNLTRVTVSAGQFVVLDSFTFHRLVLDKGKPSFIYNIEFMPRPAHEYNPFGVNDMIRINFGSLMRETALQRIAANTDGYAVLYDSQQVGAALQELILQLTNDIRSPDDAVAAAIGQAKVFNEISKCVNTREASSFSYIRKTNAYLQENYMRKIVVDSIAEAVGVSKAYLHRQYKKYTGNTILETINTLRMQKAAELLTDSDVAINKVAARVGFSNTNQLNYEFKKAFGVSAGEYRKSHCRFVDHHAPFHDSHSITVLESPDDKT